MSTGPTIPRIQPVVFDLKKKHPKFKKINKKANLRDFIAATGLVILLKLNSNHWFFSPYDLEIRWLTLKNNRAPLLDYLKLCASFHSYRSIQTGYSLEMPKSGQNQWFFVSLSQNAAKMRKINRPWPQSNQFRRWSRYICNYQISGHSSHVFSRKCPETPNLTSFLASMKLEIWQMTLKK